jgi:hypothetical protein
MPSKPNILGHTRIGKPVIEPMRGAPNTNDVTVFHHTKAKFPGWTKADHMDAARLLEGHGAGNPRSHSMRWSSVHWDIGGRWTAPEFEAYHQVKL